MASYSKPVLQCVLIIVVGCYGTGKSAVANLLARLFDNFCHIDGDCPGAAGYAATRVMGAERSCFTLAQAVEAMLRGEVAVLSTGAGVLQGLGSSKVDFLKYLQRLCPEADIHVDVLAAAKVGSFRRVEYDEMVGSEERLATYTDEEAIRSVVAFRQWPDNVFRGKVVPWTVSALRNSNFVVDMLKLLRERANTRYFLFPSACQFGGDAEGFNACVESLAPELHEHMRVHEPVPLPQPLVLQERILVSYQNDEGKDTVVYSTRTFVKDRKTRVQAGPFVPASTHRATKVCWTNGSHTIEVILSDLFGEAVATKDAGPCGRLEMRKFVGVDFSNPAASVCLEVTNASSLVIRVSDLTIQEIDIFALGRYAAE